MKAYSLFVSFFLSLVLWSSIAIVCILLTTFGILFAPLFYLFDHGRGSFHHQIAHFWGAWSLLPCPFWKIKAEGLGNIDPQKHYVLVSNHQSMLDILVLLAVLPHHFKFLAKKELFSLPFLGWHITLAGYIPVDRKSAESGRRAIHKANHYLSEGISVLFFPEGTRSLDGEIHEFKAGAFKLAQEHHVEVLPVVIDRTYDAIPKNSWMIQKPTTFLVSVGKAVPIPESPSKHLLIETCHEVRQEMIERLHRLRRENA